MTPPGVERTAGKRARAGRLLDAVGQLGLPLLVGVAVGFYAADRGVRLLPSLLEALSVGFVLALLAILVGNWLKGKAVRETAAGLALRKRVVACLLLALAAAGVRLAVYWAEQPTPLTRLDAAEFERAFALDSRRYAELDDTMDRLVAALERSEAFEREGPPRADHEGALVETWAAIYDHAVVLDQLRTFYEDWYRFDPSRVERSRHLRSFLLTYAAELALFEKASRLVHRAEGNRDAVKFLNAPHPDADLPADTFSHLRQELLGARDQARVLAGSEYLELLAEALDGRREASAAGVEWLWRRAEEHLEVIGTVAPIDRTRLTLGSDLEILRRTVRRAWFPAQKGIAEWMGDTRLRRPGWYLITEEQVAGMARELEPGDVLLSRKNWYLSNVGLPGFWPHAILYVGSPAELESYFDDPAVHAWVEEESGEPVSFGQLLAERHPSQWLHYRIAQRGEPHRVIEAVSEGVILNSLEEAAGDYLAALRPRLGKLAKAQAIAEAFGHLEKPYDYDFDFATDHALVCTELVWRSYRPADGKDGLALPLVEIAGRHTLPANEIAALFARELGQPDAQLDFVYFLDAHERAQRADRSDLEAFLGTPRRTRWDVALR